MTSRLGTGKSITFFYSVKLIFPQQTQADCYLNFFLSKQSILTKFADIRSSLNKGKTMYGRLKVIHCTGKRKKYKTFSVTIQ